MCESIEFPGQNFISAPDALRYGPPRESVTGVTYAPITATFICNYQMYEKRWFEAWQNQCMDMNTWEPNYYKDYTGELKIYQLDRDNAATYVVELFEVYPKTITAQALSNATNDAYHTLSVELMYHHWEYAAEETVSERNSPVIRLSASVIDIYSHERVKVKIYFLKPLLLLVTIKMKKQRTRLLLDHPAVVTHQVNRHRKMPRQKLRL